jgi:hypothetical protein
MQEPVDGKVLARQYPLDRQALRRVAGWCVVLLLFLGALAFSWVATRPVDVDETGAGDVAVLRAQVEELSNSQDRFQQAIAALATVAGAGLAALVGFNFYASNRNAEREAQALEARVNFTLQKVYLDAHAVFDTLLEEERQKAEQAMKSEAAAAKQHALEALWVEEKRIEKGLDVQQTRHLQALADTETKGKQAVQNLVNAMYSEALAEWRHVHQLLLAAMTLHGRTVQQHTDFNRQQGNVETADSHYAMLMNTAIEIGKAFGPTKDRKGDDGAVRVAYEFALAAMLGRSGDSFRWALGLTHGHGIGGQALPRNAEELAARRAAQASAAHAATVPEEPPS